MQGFSFDLTTTHAILIGVEQYEYLDPVGPALTCVDDFQALLLDKKIVGLPANQITVIKDQRSDIIYKIVKDILRHPEQVHLETIILYYVGHGIVSEEDNGLYLTGVNTFSENVGVSAISFESLKKLLENSRIQHRLIFLDACFSGSAAMDAGEQADIDISGSYIITSSARDEKSLFEIGARNTYFTKELLNVLKFGVAAKQPFLSMDTLFEMIQSRMKVLNKSRPKRKSTLTRHEFFFAKNARYDLLGLEQECELLFNNKEYAAALKLYLNLVEQLPTEVIRERINICKYHISLNKAETVDTFKHEKKQPVWRYGIFVAVILSVVLVGLIFIFLPGEGRVTEDKPSPEVKVVDASPEGKVDGDFLVFNSSLIMDRRTSYYWLIAPDKHFDFNDAEHFAVTTNVLGKTWRIPTKDQLGTIFDEKYKAGKGYLFKGDYYPAHIPPVFDAVGSGVWFWVSDLSKQAGKAYNVNMNQFNAREVDWFHDKYPIHLLLVAE